MKVVIFLIVCVVCSVVVQSARLWEPDVMKRRSTFAVKEETGDYGPWIVEVAPDFDFDPIVDSAGRIHRTYADDPIHKRALEVSPFEIMDEFRPLVNAFMVRGVTKRDLEQLEGVEQVYANDLKSTLQATITTPVWQQDRIDQATGLSGTYTPAYTGSGVNVYVIDSGCDSTHSEFSSIPDGGSLTNLWSAAGLNSATDNNDDYGHGTFVAGKIMVVYFVVLTSSILLSTSDNARKCPS
jgi:subtilisin family serine protease